MQTTILLLIIIILFIYSIKVSIDSKAVEKSFISIVNHTFRTPLTRIKWMSDNMNPDMPRNEQQEINKNISNTTNHLLEIVETLAGIQDVNNSSLYSMKTASLREIIEEGISKYKNPINDKKIKLQIPALNSLPLLSVDTKKISFAIHAVLGNAIWYSKPGGTVSIGAKVEGGNIVLAIEDTGIGMTGKDKRNIFKRFYRSTEAVKMNTDGMGLSLYIAKKIIEHHNGQIKLSSKGAEMGSIFYISLPISK